MARWYVLRTKTAFSVRKTAPTPAEGRYAFGPYKTKRKACQVAAYQAGETGTPVRGCRRR